MSENLKESLSALMDDEAGDFELRRILKESAEDEALLETWERYHLVRDTLQSSEARQPSGNILAGIQAAIGDEPLEAPAGKPFRFGRALGQGSIAASVALALLFSVHTLRSTDDASFEQSGATGLAESGVIGEEGNPAQLSASGASNRYVETEFNRNVSFSNDAGTLDSRTRDRLREAVEREFERYSLVPQIPGLETGATRD